MLILQAIKVYIYVCVCLCLCVCLVCVCQCVSVCVYLYKCNVDKTWGYMVDVMYIEDVDTNL